MLLWGIKVLSASFKTQLENKVDLGIAIGK